MNITWGDNNRRRASLYVDKVVYPSPPGAEWKNDEWIQSFSRIPHPDPRSIISILPARDIAYDELIEGIDLNPSHWNDLFSAVEQLGYNVYLAVAWNWPQAVLPILELAHAYKNVIICPEWYLYPWRGPLMNDEAWQSAYWLAANYMLNSRCCPLTVVANRPDLGDPYNSFDRLRGLKGGQTQSLMRFQKSYSCYNAGIWGANYPAPATPIGVRDDAVQQFDSCIEIGFWT